MIASLFRKINRTKKGITGVLYNTKLDNNFYTRVIAKYSTLERLKRSKDSQVFSIS